MSSYCRSCANAGALLRVSWLCVFPACASLLLSALTWHHLRLQHALAGLDKSGSTYRELAEAARLDVGAIRAPSSELQAMSAYDSEQGHVNRDRSNSLAVAAGNVP